MKEQPIIYITLTQAEWDELNKPINSSGGFQTYLRNLQYKCIATASGFEFSFNKEELGDLIFHMIYGWTGSRGGYQGRLRRAFRRTIIERIGE